MITNLFYIKIFSAKPFYTSLFFRERLKMELLCPAGNLASLKVALNAGADAIYLGLKDDTNARSFAGLNFTPKKLAQAVDYTKQQGKKIFLTIIPSRNQVKSSAGIKR